MSGQKHDGISFKLCMRFRSFAAKKLQFKLNKDDSCSRRANCDKCTAVVTSFKNAVESGVDNFGMS